MTIVNMAVASRRRTYWAPMPGARPGYAGGTGRAAEPSPPSRTGFDGRIGDATATRLPSGRRRHAA